MQRGGKPIQRGVVAADRDHDDLDRDPIAVDKADCIDNSPRVRVATLVHDNHGDRDWRGRLRLVGRVETE
jgi:hypothetical protein